MTVKFSWIGNPKIPGIQPKYKTRFNADIYFILSVSDTFNKRSDIIRVSDAEAIRGGGSSIDFDFFWAVGAGSGLLG